MAMDLLSSMTSGKFTPIFIQGFGISKNDVYLKGCALQEEKPPAINHGDLCVAQNVPRLEEEIFC